MKRKTFIAEFPDGRYGVGRKRGFWFFSYYEFLSNHGYWWSDNQNVSRYCTVTTMNEAKMLLASSDRQKFKVLL